MQKVNLINKGEAMWFFLNTKEKEDNYSLGKRDNGSIAHII